MKKKIKKPQITQEPDNGIIKVKKTKIRVVGVGGGGSSIISEIASRIKKASFVAANTDVKALKEVKRNVLKFHFGENLTHGLGTGMNPELGEMAALANKDEIKKIFEGQDLCIIVACLGGGTGSGAGPIFAKIAKNAGCLTYGIFTMPFVFEGEKKAAIAKEALGKLKSKLHAFSVIPNERIFQIIQKETPLRQALSEINESLASGIEGLIEIIYEPGLINIDFADLRTILDGQGKLAYLNTVEIPRKEGVIQETTEKLLNSPLYPYGIKGAKGVLYNIAGEKRLSLSEVSQISKTISDMVNKDAKIIFGIAQNQRHSDSIKIELLATGCGTKIFSGNNQQKPQNNTKTKKKVKTEEKTEEKKEDVLVKEKQKQGSRLSAKKKNKNSFGKKKLKPARKQKPAIKKIKIRVLPKREESADKYATENKEGNSEPKVRKNALQIKKESDQEEEEMLAREKFWETPAFLRRKK
jgi:cell division protein FtsZ